MVSQNGLNFGDVLLYTSKRTQRKTPCIYVRKQSNDVAVVLFRHAISVAKVNCCRLELLKEASANSELVFSDSEELVRLFTDLL